MIITIANTITVSVRIVVIIIIFIHITTIMIMMSDEIPPWVADSSRCFVPCSGNELCR